MSNLQRQILLSFDMALRVKAKVKSLFRLGFLTTPEGLLFWTFYFVFAGISAYIYRFQHNPDGISYLVVSKQYLSGHFNDAINPYWSPLLSWLLIPFLGLGVHPFAAPKIFYFLFNILSLSVIAFGLKRLNVSKHVHLVTLLTAVGFLSYASNLETTPDPILGTLLLIYMFVVIDRKYLSSTKNAAWAGSVGALAYYSKAYALPFFLIHFPLMHFFHWKDATTAPIKHAVTRNFLIGIVAFFLVSSPWIAIISVKAGFPTFSSASQYTKRLYGPGSRGVPLGSKLLPPPTASGFCVWDNITPHIGLVSDRDWSPFHSKAEMSHAWLTVKQNVADTFKFLNEYSALWIALLAGMVLIGKSSIMTWGLLLTFALYLAGYQMLVVTPRYLYFAFFFLLVFGSTVIDQLISKMQGAQNRGKVLFFLLLFSSSFLVSPLNSLRSERSSGRWLYGLAEILRVKHGIPGDRAFATLGNWHLGQPLGFLLKGRYFGAEKVDISASDLDRDLRKFKVDYFAYFGGNDALRGYLSAKYAAITDPEFPGFYLFKIRE